MVVRKWNWFRDIQKRLVNVLAPVVESIVDGVSEIFKDSFDCNIVDRGGTIILLVNLYDSIEDVERHVIAAKSNYYISCRYAKPVSF